MSENAETAAQVERLPTPIRRRKPGLFHWKNLLKLAGVIVGIYIACWEYWPGTHFSVTWKNTHGLHAGALVTYNGDPIGKVRGTEHLIDEGLVKVLMEIDPERRDLADRLLIDTTRFYIDRPDTDNLRLIHAEQAIRPRSVVVKTGSPNALARSDFEGRAEIPPTGDGVFVTVIWEKISYLKENGEVTVGEGVVGLVSQLDRGELTNEWHVELYIPRDLARVQSRFHLRTVRADLSGISGIEAGLFGTKVAIVPSRYPDSAENLACHEFRGESTPAPRHLPKPGDVPVLLRMTEQLVGPDTPIKFRGGYAGGYVDNVLPASDGSGYLAHGFIRASMASRLYTQTVFWVDRGLLIPDITLGRLIMGDVASVQLDPERALQGPTIWFNTPEDPGEKVDLNDVPPYVLHPKEQDGFRTSYAPIPSALNPDRGAEIELLAAEITWYPDSRWTLFRGTSFKGYVVPVSGGVVGPAELLTIGEGGAYDSIEFNIGGENREFVRSTWTANGIAFTPFTLNVPSFSDEKLSCVLDSHPLDVHLAGRGGAKFAVSAALLTRDGDQWIVDGSVPSDHEMHGKPVFADDSNKVIGVFLYPKGAEQARIALLPRTFESQVPNAIEK